MAVALIAGLYPHVAFADTSSSYAAVVCKDNRALIRFTEEWNYDKPVFSHSGESLDADQTPHFKSIAPDLDSLDPKDPSRCTLSDGREIVLRQGGLGDVHAYGECGADETQIFSLWIGGKKIYSREVWHPKCGSPQETVEILLNGDRLTECASTQDELGGDARPPVCNDVSSRLAQPLAEDTDMGKVSLLRFASGAEAFCRGFIKPVPPPAPDTPPAYMWPTWIYDGEQTVILPHYVEADPAPPVDIDNDGKPDRLVQFWGETGGPNADEAVLAVLPTSATDEMVVKLKRDLEYADDAKVKSLRASGVKVFAGDQTAFGRIDEVHLTPFRLDGKTWIYATSVGEMVDAGIILLPTPAGELRETCVFDKHLPL